MRTGPRLKPALPASAAAATDKAQQLGQSTAKLLPDHDGGAVERRLPPLPPSPPGQRQRRETLAAAQMAPSTDGRFGPSPPRERLAQEANGAQPVEASRRAATSPGTCSTRAHLHWPPRSQIRVLRNTSGHRASDHSALWPRLVDASVTPNSKRNICPRVFRQRVRQRHGDTDTL